MSRRRKQHNPTELKCPHCVKPEKWCKNLSGLTQHINSVHLELYRAPSPLPPSSRSPSPPSHPDLDLPNPLLGPSSLPHSPQPFGEDEPGVEREPHARRGARDDLEPGQIEYHGILNGRPCDATGEDLPDQAAPSPRTDAVCGDWGPFDDRVQFELTEFLFKKEQMPQSNINILLDLWAADVLRYGGQPPFADYVDLYRTIDSIKVGDVPWQCLKISYEGPHPDHDVPAWMTDTYEIWFRDPHAVTLKMLANPDFEDGFDTTPYREFTMGGERRYGNLMSGDWAWRQSERISEEVPNSNGAMLVTQVFGSDKTTVSVATGQNDFYPLYMSLGNLHNGVRRAHRDSILPIAFLAIPKAERKYADTTAFRRFRRQLFHTSLAAIMQTLKPGMSVPEVVRCPDGHFRRAVWAIGPYIADYPEQVLVANIVQGWCPACLHYPGKLDATEPGQTRTRVHTEALLRIFEPSALWDDYGVVADVTPFTHDFPRANINELLSGDLLHQVIKGTFKDHLELLDEIDRRLAATPPFPGLRHFKQGRDFKQWTGDDSKALMKIYLPAISGIVPAEIVRTFAAFLEFCYLARRSHLTESTLAQMDAARRRFNESREFFRDHEVRSTGFSLPRQHSLEHYLQHIRNFGAPNGLCSSMTEAKHIKAVKEPWRRSNRFEALGQMLLTNQRLEKLSAARVDFTARGMMSGTCLSAALTALQETEEELGRACASAEEELALDVEDQEYALEDPPGGGAVVDVEDAILDIDEAAVGVVSGPRVTGFAVLACKPQPHYPRSPADLALHIGIPTLPMLLARFLQEQAHLDSDEPSPPDETLPYPVGRIHVFHSATATFYAPSDPSGIGGMHREHIRATPSWRKGPARYDCVFLGKDPSELGFRSLHVARVRLLFSFRPDPLFSVLDTSEDIPCALVEWFSPVDDEPDGDTGLWEVEPDLDDDGSRILGVVHLETVLRSAHLIPVFGEDPVPLRLRSSDALDSFRAYYVNKYADHHAHEIAF
ncbi:hypothetical protein BV20DRAFT_1056861 [Pilatotrama ljubarskyi]|nr:hypothetical protein BV20DRAFT_1056861 [Pilatotrama ljubarskyi]